MDPEIRFSWQVLYRLERPFFGGLTSAPFLHVKEPSNYFDEVSASNPRLYHPIDFVPTNILHRKLRNAIADKFGISVRQKNFPYEIDVALFGRPLNVGASIQAFFPDLVSVRIDSHTFCPLDEAMAFDQRRLYSHRVLAFIANFLARVVQPPSTNEASPKRLQAKPIIHLHVAANEYLADHRLFLAALLINDAHYHNSNPGIFERVLQENDQHNQKGEKSRLILISKQGFLYVTTPDSAHSALVEQEIKKKERLFGLGFALNYFYDSYAATRRNYVREMDHLFFATRPYIKSPKLTFRLSYGNTAAWSLIMAEFDLVEAFDSTGRFDADAESVIGRLFDQLTLPKYSCSSFWQQVDHFLGEDYITK